MSGKHKRVPLQRAPFRAPPSERELFDGSKNDAALQKKLLANLKAFPPPRAESDPAIGAIDKPADSALISVMAGRLTAVEAEMKRLREELSGKDALIAALKRKVDTLKAQIPSTDTATYISQLETQNRAAKQQLHEMELFLNDYGLIWVGAQAEEESEAPDAAAGQSDDDGGDDDDASSNDANGENVEPNAGAVEPLVLDWVLLRRRIEELNFSAGEGIGAVVSDDKTGRGKLSAPQSLDLVIYRNGFFLGKGSHFRPLSSKSATSFLRDILDGYFPYELKDKHPEGVPFKLEEHPTTDYVQRQAFPGAGVRLSSGERAVERGAAAAAADARVHGVRDAAVQGAVRTDDYLSRLPQAVVRGGRVIRVRDDVAAVLKGSSASESPDVVIADTEVVEIISKNTDGRPQTPRDIATLQIRSSDAPTLIVKLRFDDTLTALFAAVRKHRPGGGPFELRSSFPPRVYAEGDATLRTSGLVPSATLFIR